MSKIHPQKYRTLTGDIKVNCYTIQIPKVLLESAGIDETTELNIKQEKNKIIIEGVKNGNYKKE